MTASPTTRPTQASAASTPATPAHERLGMTVALAVLGVFVTYMPITGVSVSLDAIARATGASTSDLQWVSDAYVIPMAAAVLSAGVFGDIHGRRRLYSLGMVLTIIGASVAGLAALAGSGALAQLWIGQAVSGLGAGILLPTTLALIAHAVPDPHERGRYIGMWATGMVVGLALGPLVSGVLLQAGGWGWIFAPVVALALFAGIFAHFALPESRSPQGRSLDWGGQVSATVAIASTIFGTIEGGSNGWGSPGAIIGLAVGAVAIAAFIVIEARSASPLMDLGLFRSGAFAASALAALMALFSVVGTMFLLSIFLGSVQNLSPLEIGVRLLFVTGVAALANPAVGRLMRRVKPLTLLSAGLLVTAAGILLLTGVDSATGLADLAWRLAVMGIGMAFMLTPISVVAINAVPWQLAGMASATSTAFRQYGGALGPAVLGAVFASRLAGGAGAAEALHAALMTTVALLLVAAVGCLLAVIPWKRATTPDTA